jgi:hypothetical protein
MTTTPLAAPRLAPPGAGTPAIERLIGGAVFALRRWRGTRERFSAEFTRERNTIAGLYAPLDERVLRTRVLIPRLRGLEDSSRFWSVLMTLDHLRIVNHQIAGVIAALAREVLPPGKASTAAVKPSPDVGPEVIAPYEASCDRLSDLVATCGNFGSRARYAHPWFGPLNAAGWHAMAAMHLGIHRAQIARILRDQTRSSR